MATLYWWCCFEYSRHLQVKVKALCHHYDCVTPWHEITEDLILHVTPCRHLKEEYVRQRVAYLTGYSVVQNNATVTLIGAEVFCELYRSSISITETDRVVEDYITSSFSTAQENQLAFKHQLSHCGFGEMDRIATRTRGATKNATETRTNKTKVLHERKRCAIRVVFILYNGIF